MEEYLTPEGYRAKLDFYLEVARESKVLGKTIEMDLYKEKFNSILGDLINTFTNTKEMKYAEIHDEVSEKYFDIFGTTINPSETKKENYSELYNILNEKGISLKG